MHEEGHVLPDATQSLPVALLYAVERAVSQAASAAASAPRANTAANATATKMSLEVVDRMVREVVRGAADDARRFVRRGGRCRTRMLPIFIKRHITITSCNLTRV